MTSERDEREPARSPQLNSGDDDNAQGQEPGELIEDVKASGQPVVALHPERQKNTFRHRALWVISGLIVFFAVITLGAALAATLIVDETERNTVATLASDIAKSAIPTLIALLGTAAAWAFKDSEKD